MTMVDRFLMRPPKIEAAIFGSSTDNGQKKTAGAAGIKPGTCRKLARCSPAQTSVLKIRL